MLSWVCLFAALPDRLQWSFEGWRELGRNKFRPKFGATIRWLVCRYLDIRIRYIGHNRHHMATSKWVFTGEQSPKESHAESDLHLDGKSLGNSRWHFFVLVSRAQVDFFCSFSECADTEQLERQVLRARFLGLISIFTGSQMRESNLGQLGEKRERILCAMPSPPRAQVDKKATIQKFCVGHT